MVSDIWVDPLDLIAMPRSKLDFFAHVLETARKGTTRELIASENNVCHGLVENSLSPLKDLDLLAERHNSPVSFVTTEGTSVSTRLFEVDEAAGL